jgi:hypothetical protein
VKSDIARLLNDNDIVVGENDFFRIEQYYSYHERKNNLSENMAKTITL